MDIFSHLKYGLCITQTFYFTLALFVCHFKTVKTTGFMEFMEDA